MNIEQLRRLLKTHWLAYYQENRSWLTKLGIWVNCEGQRRPSSSFILAALSTLEPQLTQVLPLVVDLSSNPDRIVIALGLNFNPDDELEALAAIEPAPMEATKMLPASSYVSLPDLSRTVEQRSPVIQAAATQNRSRKPDLPEAAPPAISQPEPPQWRSPVNQPDLSAANSRQSNSSQPNSSQPDLSGSSQPLEERSPHRRPLMDTAELSPGQLPERI